MTAPARDLRATLLRVAAEVVTESGVGEVSVRALARAAGVSHAAHRYHFASRSGLLSALAAEGHRMLAGALEEAATTSFLDVGVAYVAFAHDHPGHFAVMFAPDALDEDDPELAAARARTFSVLAAGVDALAVEGRIEDARAAVVAAWSLVHGLAVLAATGNLSGAGLAPPPGREALLELARRAAGMLYGSPEGGTGHA
ncbi:TetR family transcriptional regulator [Blastococcus colisei]|uniref:TetR family transcriptional regulator n=1 Tax=Blastococcus colisei TaxID=1564162 RepID=A0A543P106_9ACTN|nr:TetR/AcrR family transcriptional regulator [Blastococcus colisei]TQN37777.1 TetR family transcriptional regulator [Blastococcus colisei]